jgi:hypothetical protein
MLVAVLAIVVVAVVGCSPSTSDQQASPPDDRDALVAPAPQTTVLADIDDEQAPAASRECAVATRAMLAEIVPAMRSFGQDLQPITTSEQLGESLLDLLIADVLPQRVEADPTTRCVDDLDYAQALVAELAALDGQEVEPVVDLAHGVFGIGCSTPGESDLDEQATVLLCDGIESRFASRGIDVSP